MLRATPGLLALQLLGRVEVGPAHPPAGAHLPGVVMDDDDVVIRNGAGDRLRLVRTPTTALPMRRPPPPNDRSMPVDPVPDQGRTDPWDWVLLAFGAVFIALMVFGILFVRV